LVVGVDDSGSMREVAGARDSALDQLMAWAPKNLRADDQIAVIDFAETSAVRLPTTGAQRVGVLGGMPGAVRDGHDTLLGPVLAQLSSQQVSGCRTALALISDAQLADLPATEDAGRALVAEGHVDDVRLLVPGKDVDVPKAWNQAFPAARPERFDGRNQDETAVAIGQVIAGLTGQHLKRTGA
jgi:hypothetical protein